MPESLFVRVAREGVSKEKKKKKSRSTLIWLSLLPGFQTELSIKLGWGVTYARNLSRADTIPCPEFLNSGLTSSLVHCMEWKLRKNYQCFQGVWGGRLWVWHFILWRSPPTVNVAWTLLFNLTNQIIDFALERNVAKYMIRKKWSWDKKMERVEVYYFLTDYLFLWAWPFLWVPYLGWLQTHLHENL